MTTLTPEREAYWRKYIDDFLDLRPTQKEVFDTIWYNPTKKRTLHIAKRRAGKTTASIRIMWLLAFCAAGWIHPVSQKQIDLIQLHRKVDGQRKIIADPFRIGFYTSVDENIDAYINDTIWQFYHTWPEEFQKRVKKTGNIWRIKGREPDMDVIIIIKGVGRQINNIRGAGFDAIFVDEIQMFKYEDIETVVLPMLGQTKRRGWIHYFGTANIDTNSKEIWEIVKEHEFGAAMKTTAYDCLEKDPEYEQADFDLAVQDAGGIDSPTFKAEHLCDFDIPSRLAILGHWEPKYTNMKYPNYILSVDIGNNPYVLQKFYIDDNHNLVYSHRISYWNEEAIVSNMAKENVDVNCKCVILPHDARKISTSNGKSHFQVWKEALAEIGLSNTVTLKLLEQHASVSDRIAETNALLYKIRVKPQSSKVDHVHQLKQAQRERSADNRTRIKGDIFSHYYDAFTHGVGGYYNYYRVGRDDIPLEKEEEYSEMKAFITGDKKYSIAYGRAKFLENVDTYRRMDDDAMQNWQRDEDDDDIYY